MNARYFTLERENYLNNSNPSNLEVNKLSLNHFLSVKGFLYISLEWVPFVHNEPKVILNSQTKVLIQLILISVALCSTYIQHPIRQQKYVQSRIDFQINHLLIYDEDTVGNLKVSKSIIYKNSNLLDSIVQWYLQVVNSLLSYVDGS